MSCRAWFGASLSLYRCMTLMFTMYAVQDVGHDKMPWEFVVCNMEEYNLFCSLVSVASLWLMLALITLFAHWVSVAIHILFNFGWQLSLASGASLLDALHYYFTSVYVFKLARYSQPDLCHWTSISVASLRFWLALIRFLMWPLVVPPSLQLVFHFVSSHFGHLCIT